MDKESPPDERLTTPTDAFDKAAVGYAVSRLLGKEDVTLTNRRLATDILDRFEGDPRLLLEPHGGLGAVVATDAPDDVFRKWLMTPIGMRMYAKLKAKYPSGFEKKVQFDASARIDGDPFAPYEKDLSTLVEKTAEHYSALTREPLAQSVDNVVEIDLDPAKQARRDEIIREALTGTVTIPGNRARAPVFSSQQNVDSATATAMPTAAAPTATAPTAAAPTATVPALEEALQGLRQVSDEVLKSCPSPPEFVPLPQPTTTDAAQSENDVGQKYIRKIQELANERDWLIAKVEHAACLAKTQSGEIREMASKLTAAQMKLRALQDVDPVKTQEHIRALQDEVENGKIERAECESRLREIAESEEAKVRVLEMELSRLRADAAEATKKSRESGMRIALLEEDARKRVREFRQRSEQLEDTVAARDRIIRRLQEEKGVLQSNLAVASGGSGGIQHFHGSAQEVSQLKSLLAERDRTIGDLEADKQRLEGRIASYREEPPKLFEDTFLLNAAESTYKSLYEEKDRENRDLLSRLEQRDNTIDKLRRNQDALEVRTRAATAGDDRAIAQDALVRNTAESNQELRLQLQKAKEQVEVLACVNAELKEHCTECAQKSQLHVTTISSDAAPRQNDDLHSCPACSQRKSQSTNAVQSLQKLLLQQTPQNDSKLAGLLADITSHKRDMRDKEEAVKAMHRATEFLAELSDGSRTLVGSASGSGDIEGATRSLEAEVSRANIEMQRTMANLLGSGARMGASSFRSVEQLVSSIAGKVGASASNDEMGTATSGSLAAIVRKLDDGFFFPTGKTVNDFLAALLLPDGNPPTSRYVILGSPDKVKELHKIIADSPQLWGPIGTWIYSQPWKSREEAINAINTLRKTAGESSQELVAIRSELERARLDKDTSDNACKQSLDTMKEKHEAEINEINSVLNLNLSIIETKNERVEELQTKLQQCRAMLQGFWSMTFGSQPEIAPGNEMINGEQFRNKLSDLRSRYNKGEQQLSSLLPQQQRTRLDDTRESISVSGMVENFEKLSVAIPKLIEDQKQRDDECKKQMEAFEVDYKLNIDQLNSRMQATKERENVLQDENEKLQEQISEEMEKIDSLRTEHKKVEGILFDTQTKLKETEDRAESLKNENVELLREKIEAKENADNVGKKHENIEGALSNANNKLEVADEREKALRKEIGDLQENILKEKTNLDNLQKECQKDKTTLTDTESKLKETEDREKSLQSENTDLREKIVEEKKTLDKFVTENQNINSILNDTQRKLRQMELQVETLQSENVRANEKMTSTNTELQTAKIALAEMRNEMSEFQKRYYTASEEYSNMKNQLETCNANNKKLQNEYDTKFGGLRQELERNNAERAESQEGVQRANDAWIQFEKDLIANIKKVLQCSEEQSLSWEEFATRLNEGRKSVRLAFNSISQGAMDTS